MYSILYISTIFRILLYFLYIVSLIRNDKTPAIRLSKPTFIRLTNSFSQLANHEHYVSSNPIALSTTTTNMPYKWKQLIIRREFGRILKDVLTVPDSTEENDQNWYWCFQYLGRTTRLSILLVQLCTTWSLHKPDTKTLTVALYLRRAKRQISYYIKSTFSKRNLFLMLFTQGQNKNFSRF